jgi:uncharacterized membrane protein YphA (DoxX/SURF4 family)
MQTEATTTTPNAATTERAPKPVVRYLATAARILMGLIFFVFGLDGFLHFIPQPGADAMPAGAMAFADAMMKTGYLFQLVKGTELIVGALLLLNRFVPLALALIAPVIVNIFAFSAFLAPSGVGLAVVLVVFEVYLAWAYRKTYRSMLVARATP